MESLYHFILTNTAGLYRVIYSSPFFFIDYWSFIHFGSGIFLMATATMAGLKRPWPLLFAILVGYELLELAFIYLAINVFRPETLTDQLTDIVIGALGALSARFLAKRALRDLFVTCIRWLHAGARTDALTAVGMAFIWVRFYGYSYNVVILNSPYVNWWALTLWTVGLYLVIHLHRRLRGTLSRSAATVSVWGIALLATLVVEYVGYKVLGIRETGGYPPLVLGLVHGTPLLKFYYIVAAPTAVVTAAFLNRIVRKASLATVRLSTGPATGYCNSMLAESDTISTQ